MDNDPQDSLDSEQGETSAQHAPQPGQILHLIPILAPSSASLNLSTHPKAVSIPPAHIQAPLPTLNGEAALCLAYMVGSSYGVDPASSAELPHWNGNCLLQQPGCLGASGESTEAARTCGAEQSIS